MPVFLPIDLDPLPEEHPDRAAASRPDGGILTGVDDEATSSARNDAELAREYISHGELLGRDLCKIGLGLTVLWLLMSTAMLLFP